MTPFTLRYICLIGSLALAKSALAAPLTDNEFWRRNAGTWSNHNTYLNNQFDHNIKSYHSAMIIEVQDENVTIKETKFYPPETFYGAAIGLDIDSAHGVEFVSETKASAINDTATVAFENEKGPYKTVITPLTTDTALLTVNDKRSARDNYRMFITIPDANHRFAVNIGINSPDSDSADTNLLRGLSFFNGTKVDNTSLQKHLEQWRQLYRVKSRVTFRNGEYHHQDLSNSE